VNDNGTHVGRAECLDEHLRTEGRAVLTDSMGSENSRGKLNGFRAWLSLPLGWVFLFLLC